MEYLAILLQGTEMWNTWRKRHPGERPYLVGADLTLVDLRGADLTLVDLRGADLTRADLSEVNLSEVNLSEVNLSGVNFHRANLNGTDLRELDLSEVDLGKASLNGANLSKTNLTNANLSEANLTNANLSEANLTNANLSRAHLVGALLDTADLSGADLSSADLRRASLREAQLGRANLRDANLRKADLSEANLSEANLRKADLSEANLRGANLVETDLSEAVLTSANLSGVLLSLARLTRANLIKANLYKSDLRGADLNDVTLLDANLTDAKVGNTVFTHIDLSKVTGLDTLWHRAPSVVGIDTLYQSQNKIPEIFLRGCGVPDTLIEYLPSLLGAMELVQFYSCFISYSSKDEPFAKRLHERLRAEHLRVWFAPEDIQGGRKLHEQIDEAIRMYDKLLIILSPHSRQSKWVMAELRKARTTELATNRRKLFPIRLMPMKALDSWECIDPETGQDIAAEVREYHIPDFSRWKQDHDAFEKAFVRLLRDLQAKDERPVPAPVRVATPGASGRAKVISIKQRRLQILEEQQALKGSSTPPEVIIEIEDLRREIAELEAG
jgi:uncharacterized protein YjbI with pentapeptide repeats